MSELIQHPIWAERAFREMMLDVREFPGSDHNARILEYFHATNLKPYNGDETHWCSAGINWCFRTEGITGSNLANARSFVGYGEELAVADWRPGAVCVLWRGSPDGWQGHVGYLVTWNAARVYLLGGNQGNQWSVKPFDRERILYMGWPTMDQFYARAA